ncbi:MAG: uncharacterized protein A8A55_3385, partial [Amphiamblys sp. WSBS2006]
TATCRVELHTSRQNRPSLASVPVGTLIAEREEYVSVVLEHDKTICVGRVKKMWLCKYAVSVLTKMSLEDCEFEKLILYASREEEVAAVLAHDKTISVGRVKRMELRQYAVSILPKLLLRL